MKYEVSDMNNSEQIVMIRGTHEGLTIMIDDQCSYKQVKVSLADKLKKTEFLQQEQQVAVKVQLGHRYLTKDQQTEIKEIIHATNHFIVEEIFSHVIAKEEALKWWEESQVKTFYQIVRSGQE